MIPYIVAGINSIADAFRTRCFVHRFGDFVQVFVWQVVGGPPGMVTSKFARNKSFSACVHGLSSLNSREEWIFQAKEITFP